MGFRSCPDKCLKLRTRLDVPFFIVLRFPENEFLDSVVQKQIAFCHLSIFFFQSGIFTGQVIDRNLPAFQDRAGPKVFMIEMRNRKEANNDATNRGEYFPKHRLFFNFLFEIKDHIYRDLRFGFFQSRVLFNVCRVICKVDGFLIVRREVLRFLFHLF